MSPSSLLGISFLPGQQGAGETPALISHSSATESRIRGKNYRDLKLLSATQSLLIDQEICPRHGQPRTQGLNHSHLKITGRAQVSC